MKTPLVELLYEAIASPFGILVSCEDAERLRAKLYPLRKAEAAFESLHFSLSPDQPKTHLFIIKKGDPLDAAEET